MGWDFNFFRSKKIGDLLKDENIKEESVGDDNVNGKEIYLYTTHEGEKSGIVVPNLGENYHDEYLDYGYMHYGGNALYFVWYLYKHHNIMFADGLEDLFYLMEYCNDKNEEQVLINYVCGEQMYNIFKDIIENEDELSELHAFYSEGKPLHDRLYETYQQEHKAEKKEYEPPRIIDVRPIEEDDEILPF